MEIETMGKIPVVANIENLMDLYELERGSLPDAEVRRVVVDALVDSERAILSMPKGLIQQLGLHLVGIRRARTVDGPITVQIYGTVRLTIQGHDGSMDVAELPDDGPVLIGRIPLHALDLVVDSQNRCLIGNPEHSGVQMLEMY